MKRTKRDLTNVRYLIGIDEAGRGPLAGPVSVGAVLVPVSQLRAVTQRLTKIKDSKQMTPLSREVRFADMKKMRAEGVFDFSVSLVGAKHIDEKGIVSAIRSAIKSCLRQFDVSPRECCVLLDGLLHAPREYTQQETIIGGDENEPLIALASIVAKVTRDRRMNRLAALYPRYGFEIHKGYGTQKHLAQIGRFGPCELHRVSYLKKFNSKQKQSAGNNNKKKSKS